MRHHTMRMVSYGLLGVIILQRIWFHVESQLSFDESPWTWIMRVTITIIIADGYVLVDNWRQSSSTDITNYSPHSNRFYDNCAGISSHFSVSLQ